jgi:large subunit ribosomal protein L3
VLGCAAQDGCKDGYEAVQLGYLELKEARRDNKVARGESGRRGRGEANAPTRGHFEKNGGARPTRHIAEFKLVADGDEPATGSSLTVDAMFKAGDDIKIQGTTKGSRLLGCHEAPQLRRSGRQPRFEDSPQSRLQRRRPTRRAHFPAHVVPVASVPELVTQKGLQVVEVDPGRNLLIVKGGVPGANGGLLRIEKV